MKILHIVPSYKPAYVYGGPIESVARLCEGLVTAGHQVTVYTTTANGPTELDVQPNQPVSVDGVEVIYFKRITKDPTHVSPALWKHLYQTAGQYDVVHIHSWWNILVMVATKICLIKGAKVVIAPRGMLSHYIFNSGSSKAKQLMHKWFGRRLLQQCSFHATAQAEYEECRQLIPGWQGFTLPNIIFLPDKAIESPENDSFTLLFLSRIHPKKGLELLFEALARLDTNWTLKIAGDGDEDYIISLKQLAVQYAIQEKIEWMGWLNREQKFTQLAQADLFVLTSFNENFANVVVESLYMGTPVLLSQDVALSDFVKQQDMGWVCSLQADDIVRALTAAYQQQGQRQKIRMQGRKIIDQHFSASKLVDDYVQQYQQIANR